MLHKALDNLLNQGYVYIYRGDRLTDNKYKLQPCKPMFGKNGKCVRGKNGNMLVIFDTGYCVVLARQLRRIDKMINKVNSKVDDNR